MFDFGLEKMNLTFVLTLKPLNMIDGPFFVVSLLVKTLFLPFSEILTCNCISRTYLVVVYSVNIPSTRYCLISTTENFPLAFGVVL